MCLYSWQNRKKATKDIVCYKTLNCIKGKLHSIYGRHIWELDTVYEAERAKPNYYEDEITFGYFHSYDKMFNQYSLSPGLQRYAKCIIPKDTYYYYGIHSDGHEGYASKKLKIVEIYDYLGNKIDKK